MAEDTSNLIELTIEVVSAFVSQNNIRPEDVPALIASTHAAIVALQNPPSLRRLSPPSRSTFPRSRHASHWAPRITLSR